MQFVPGESSHEDRYVQIGVVQGGLGRCGDASLPAIFTRTEDEEIFDFVRDQIDRFDVDVQLENSNLHQLSGLVLREAASTGQISNVVEAAKRTDVGGRENLRGETALHAAVRKGHSDVVNYLVLNASADVTLIDSFGVTPLYYAVATGQIDVLKFMLDHSPRANIDEQDRDGNSLLWIASDTNRHEIVNFLLKRGANPNIVARLEGTAPLNAAAEKGHLETIKVYQKLGENVIKVQIDGKSAVYWAALNGHLETLKYLIEDQGADVDDVTDTLIDNAEPLIKIAATGGHIDIVRYLIGRGADANKVTSNRHETALHAAASEGHVEIAQVLLEEGKADISPVGFGGTPFARAVIFGHLEVIKLFVEKG